MNTEGLFRFIKASPSAYHAVQTVAEMLRKDGYTELYEGEEWELCDGGKHFVIRNGSSLIAFRVPNAARGFMIVASHSDSPAFRVKKNGEQIGAYSRLDVEKYGGMIYYSWLDRPLSVAGRVVIRNSSGLEARLVNLDCDLLTIPSLAIHLNKNVNDGASFNPAKDMLPLMGSSGEKSFGSRLAATVGVGEEDILSHDLFLYNREGGRRIGKDGEFILAPRLDDLGCVYTSAAAFLAARDTASVPVLAIFDNEEVGSQTKQGAASTFLADVLGAISGNFEKYQKMLKNSFMVSADNAHALHPNHPEISDSANAPILGGGIVIKFNANQRYTTDAISHGIFDTVCKRVGVRTQTYYNRGDIVGGTTLGSISNTCVAVPTVDIGLPQLAMHSASETAAASDVDDMVKALTELYSTSILRRGNGYVFE